MLLSIYTRPIRLQEATPVGSKKAVQSTPDKFKPLGPSKLGETIQSVKLTEVVDKQRV